MLFQILTVLHITICISNASTNPEQFSNHAISSQSFVRHDVPLYKYSAVHIYSTPRPEYYNQNHLQPLKHNTNGRIIQYAPINYRGSLTITDLKKIQQARDNLEPKLTNTNTNTIETRPSHVSGYNIDVSQSNNRYPIPNVQIYPDMPENERINKASYLNQLAVNQIAHAPTQIVFIRNNKSQPSQYQNEQKQIVENPFIPSNEQYNKPNNEQKGSSMTRTEFGAVPYPTIYPPHPKTHRMMVNIAHLYNRDNQHYELQSPYDSLRNEQNKILHPVQKIL